MSAKLRLRRFPGSLAWNADFHNVWTISELGGCSREYGFPSTLGYLRGQYFKLNTLIDNHTQSLTIICKIMIYDSYNMNRTPTGKNLMSELIQANSRFCTCEKYAYLSVAKKIAGRVWGGRIYGQKFSGGHPRWSSTHFSRQLTLLEWLLFTQEITSVPSLNISRLISALDQLSSGMF